jgi:hypothetical protein
VDVSTTGIGQGEEYFRREYAVWIGWRTGYKTYDADAFDAQGNALAFYGE